jgi:hypothetical protein
MWTRVVKERILLVAIALNLLLPGLGYIYMGRVVIGLICCLVIIAIAFNSATRLGIDMWVSMWLALNLIMTVDMIILSEKNRKLLMKQKTKMCPHCGEVVHKEATICRFCNRDLSAEGHSPS